MCLAIPFGWKVSGACKIHLRFRSCDSVSEKSSGQRPTILEHQGFETQTNFRSEILRTRANSKLCKNAVVGQAWFSTWVEWRASSYRHEPLSAARWREAGGEREEHLDCRRLTQPMRTERGRFRSGSAGFQNSSSWTGLGPVSKDPTSLPWAPVQFLITFMEDPTHLDSILFTCISSSPNGNKEWLPSFFIPC